MFHFTVDGFYRQLIKFYQRPKHQKVEHVYFRLLSRTKQAEPLFGSNKRRRF